MGLSVGKGTQHSAEGRAPAVLYAGGGTGSTGNGVGLCGVCVGTGLAVPCTRLPPPSRLCARSAQAMPKAGPAGVQCAFGFNLSSCWHRKDKWKLCSTPAALLGAVTLTDHGCPGGKALEGNREAVHTSTLNQHIQELVHLLTSCYLLQQTTKRRVEGVRRRVPPATSQVGGSRPHKGLSPMQER